MTEVSILGHEPKEIRKNPIVFVYLVNDTTLNFDECALTPDEFCYIELIQKRESEKGFDIMFAYNFERIDGSIMLGHFNDGVVE